jgi:arylsulfatase A-like enzyme
MIKNAIWLIVSSSVWISAFASGTKGAVTELDLSCPKCNVVLLNIDLLRADFVGLLNHNQGVPSQTPAIDRFFQNSLIFEDVSSSSGVTAISNTATLTGRYGEFTYGLLRRTYMDTPPKMPREYEILYANTPTIAEQLHSGGYETLNLNHGWYAGKQMLLDRGIDVYFGTGETDSIDSKPGLVIEQTAKKIQERTDSTRPFYLLMRSEDLRGLPYRYPVDRPQFLNKKIEYRELTKGYYDVYFQPLSDGTLSVKFPASARINWMSNEQVAEYKELSYALYRQQLTFVNEQLENIFAAIENSHLRDNTIVVLYANHGDGLYDNRVANHGVSYQSCVSVPMLIKHPKVKTAIRITKDVALIDLAPTLYEMLGAKMPSTMDGQSLVPMLVGSFDEKYEYRFGTDKESKYVRRGDFKLIVWSDRSREFYNIKDDPNEQNSLIDLHPALVAQMYQALVNHEMEQLTRVLTLLRAERLSTERKD